MRSLTPVLEVVRETPSTVSLVFSYPPRAAPGQFVMIWLPGEDELPMSLSQTEGPRKAVTIKAMGITTRRVLEIEPGTRIGLRGPYGNSFDLSPRRILVVAGGSGAAVLAPGAEAAAARGSQITVALGATRAEELLFRERFTRIPGAEVLLSTDDGSGGEKGFVTLLAERLLRDRRFDVMWTCGPERMMQKLRDAARARSTPFFASVERHMKCALALCDACAFGPYHVCRDGPVFSGEQLDGIEDFGRYRRDPAGRRVPA